MEILFANILCARVKRVHVSNIKHYITYVSGLLTIRARATEAIHQ